MSESGSDGGFYPEDSDGDQSEELTWEDQLENSYMETKDDVDDKIEDQNSTLEELKGLIDQLQEVLELEEKAKSESFQLEKPWGYKVRKLMIKVYLKLAKIGSEEERGQTVESTVTRFREMMDILASSDGRVSKSKAEKLVVFVDLIAPASTWSLSTATVVQLFDMAFAAVTVRCGSSNSDDKLLWFKLKVKYFERLLQKEIHQPLMSIILEAEEFCKPGGVLNNKRRSQLVQLNALHMQLLCQRSIEDPGQAEKLKSLYSESQDLLEGSIVPPRTLGVIYQTGGKMFMHESQWEQAFQTFLEAFKNFNQAGDSERIRCLKYMLIAKMLHSGHDSERIESEVIALQELGGKDTEIALKRDSLAKLKKVDIFQAQDTAAFQSHPGVHAMSELVSSYLASDIDKFNAVYSEHHDDLCDDPFTQTFMLPLLVSMRTQAIFKIVKPYTTIKLSCIAQELGISPSEAESLVISLILDGKMSGKICQRTGTLHLEKGDETSKRFLSMKSMADALGSMMNKDASAR
eukprot:TRINITY_DN2139_c0_g1_i1.p1 TRINITY_DN2139_c0_g1~~TRINITY_DN2139_c0_g1_i1.p1  ORF type:complete len:519 (+),score=116.57 TRINITY_DN2139_c0_g1_i1:269-1825(+)